MGTEGIKIMEEILGREDEKEGEKGNGWDLYPGLLGFLASSHDATGSGYCVQDSGEDGKVSPSQPYLAILGIVDCLHGPP